MHGIQQLYHQKNQQDSVQQRDDVDGYEPAIKLWAKLIAPLTKRTMEQPARSTPHLHLHIVLIRIYRLMSGMFTMMKAAIAIMAAPRAIDQNFMRVGLSSVGTFNNHGITMHFGVHWVIGT